MRQLTETELQILKELKKQDVLQPLRGYQLDYRNGVIMVACADGDQMYDLFNTHASLCPSNPNHARIHLLTRNGGALMLLRNERLSCDLSKEIATASDLKHIKATALYTHTPCGIADALDITIGRSLNRLVTAKQRIDESNLHLQVACFFHVDYGQGKKRSYYVSPERLDEWLKSKKK